MCYDMIRYGWILDIPARYAATEFHFKYLGFGWVQAPPGEHGLLILLTTLAILAAMIAAGFLYRLAILAFTLGFGWFFLIDRAQYLNHFYMVWLFCVLMCLIPANRLWSIDVCLKWVTPSRLAPVWARWLLLAQLEIILIFAGLVKINPDWLNLAPLEQWLAKRDDLWLLSELFTQRWAIGIGAYGVIALHLIGAPLLLFKKTRLWALGAYAAFHSLNHFVFNIGIFPWMTLFASLLFLEPDWPRRLRARVPHSNEISSTALTQTVSLSRPLVAFIVLWLTVQLLLPLRHFTYDGDVAWNDDGHLFSWRMKLRSQRGIISYLIVDETDGETWRVRPIDYLTSKQYRKMRCRPDMILQFAHHLAERWQTEKGISPPAIYAQNYCSLNYRAHQPQVNRRIDLTQITRTDSMDTWLQPLQQQLQNRIIAWSRVKSEEVGS